VSESGFAGGVIHSFRRKSAGAPCPPGHATGSINLTPEAILMIFSTGKIEDAHNDDFRFPLEHWPILSQSVV
jgi:hypothetical protein